MNKSHKGMTEKTLPIKNNEVLDEVEEFLKSHFRYGFRNLTIFQTGVRTLLRVSDVLNLKYDDVYTASGKVKKVANIIDIKTKKHNTLYLNPSKTVLTNWHTHLEKLAKKGITSSYLFFSVDNAGHTHKMKTTQFYRVMRKTGKWLGLDYLGTHTMRKTGAYMVYKQSHYDIALVMKLLNQSSESITLRYLGIDSPTKEAKLNATNFNRI